MDGVQVEAEQNLCKSTLFFFEKNSRSIHTPFHLCFTILPVCGPSLWWDQHIIDTAGSAPIKRRGSASKLRSHQGTVPNVVPISILLILIF